MPLFLCHQKNPCQLVSYDIVVAVAGRMCRQLLQDFVVANPGAAAAGAEWGFRWRGQQLVQQPGPPCINQNSDDPADNVSAYVQPLPSVHICWLPSTLMLGKECIVAV